MKSSHSEDAAHTLHNITGLYSYTSNPCTTKPCLPGMIYAVLADGTYYYITVQGHFLSENLSWRGYTPELETFVNATGYLSSHEDIYGNSFLKIEVISLQPTKI